MNWNYEPQRVFVEDEGGLLLAEITFPEGPEGIFVINHTFVDSSLRGQGMAGKLMEAALRQIREAGGRIKPTCAYAVSWFEKHPDQVDILSE